VASVNKSARTSGDNCVSSDKVFMDGVRDNLVPLPICARPEAGQSLVIRGVYIGWKFKFTFSPHFQSQFGFVSNEPVKLLERF
jgi:hypothetical protein